MSTRMLLSLGFGAALVGCESEQSGFTVGGTDQTSECAYSPDMASLAGSEWLLLKANPDRSEAPNIRTRLQFINDDGAFRARYNVSSPADMYTYECETVGEEVICKEAAKVKDWCQALWAGGTECTAESLRSIDDSLTDAEIEEGMKAAQEQIAKFEGQPNEEAFRQANNNLGNKLRGLLYVKIDSRRCRIRVTDNYMTIYNGKRAEDSNPVGTNPFVEKEEAEGALLWEHCGDGQSLLDQTTAEFPSDPANARNVTQHDPNTEVHYWLLNEDYRVQDEKCQYSFDVWLNAKPIASDQSPTVVDGREKELHWHYGHTFAESSVPGEPEVMVWILNKNCEGADPVEHVTCNAVFIK